MDSSALICRLAKLIAAQAELYGAACTCLRADQLDDQHFRGALEDLLQAQDVQMRQAVELLLTRCARTSVQPCGATCRQPPPSAAHLGRLHRQLATRARRLLIDMGGADRAGEADLLVDIADGHDRAAGRLSGLDKKKRRSGRAANSKA